MAPKIQLDSATKKAIVIGIGALSVCVVGAILLVGRGNGSTGVDAARVGPGLSAARPDGGDGNGNDGSGAPSAPGARGAGAFEQFRSCLEDHGVTLPDPGQGRPSLPSGDLRSAFEACRGLLPGRPFGGDGFRHGDHDGFGHGDDGPGSDSGSDQSGTRTF